MPRTCPATLFSSIFPSPHLPHSSPCFSVRGRCGGCLSDSLLEKVCPLCHLSVTSPPPRPSWLSPAASSEFTVQGQRCLGLAGPSASSLKITSLISLPLSCREMLTVTSTNQSTQPNRPIPSSALLQVVPPPPDTDRGCEGIVYFSRLS